VLSPPPSFPSEAEFPSPESWSLPDSEFRPVVGPPAGAKSSPSGESDGGDYKIIG